ncbi:MAG: caspase family protein [Candidatus Azobacteroides sp.]|nr:caspase family protein [Candidatus Azobacteroides sp.]
MEYKVILLIFLFPVFLFGQTNRALIVGISDYPTESGWRKIHGANDSRLITFLLQRNGYGNINIRTLINEQATKAAIVRALQEMANQCGPGDHVYIHFSCHGQQMIDDNGDEPDGLDEALIPFDARMRFRKGEYEGENHLRDDELEILLEKIRRKTGENGNILVLLDACHSATGTREDEEYIRGTAYIFGPENAEIPETDGSRLNLRLKKEKELSPITVLSACLENQKNSEYKMSGTQSYYGSLTYAFYKIAEKATGKVSCQQLAERIKKEMKMLLPKRNQIPFFESTDEKGIFKLSL